MNLSDQLIHELKLNYGVIQMQTDGLTREDSLLQLPFRGNCLNWVLGHIVESRAGMLTVAGIQPLWDNEVYSIYERDSEPIDNGDDALSMERILTDLGRAQEALLVRLPKLTSEEWGAVLDDGDRTVYQRLSFSSWHETYHTGQCEYLRQLAGKNDKVI